MMGMTCGMQLHRNAIKSVVTVNCQGIEMHVERSSKSTEMPAEVERAKKILQLIEEEERIHTIEDANELSEYEAMSMEDQQNIALSGAKLLDKEMKVA